MVVSPLMKSWRVSLEVGAKAYCDKGMHFEVAVRVRYCSLGVCNLPSWWIVRTCRWPDLVVCCVSRPRQDIAGSGPCMQDDLSACNPVLPMAVPRTTEAGPRSNLESARFPLSWISTANFELTPLQKNCLSFDITLRGRCR